MKNKNIKLIIIPLTILMIFTCIVISMQTYSQYKKISVITNEKISEIIEYIIKENPAIDTKKIIQILNSNEYKVGEEELKKYGINIEEVNSIIAVQKQMKTNIILNIILIVSFNALYMAIIFIYLKQRDKKINQITQYINEIKNRKYDLDINENSEDELSNLKNELYKITIMLKEESEISRQDKENIKIAILIGPEGGIDITEIEELRKAGAVIVTLGKRILRTETVALNVLSIIMYELEN